MVGPKLLSTVAVGHGLTTRVVITIILPMKYYVAKYIVWLQCQQRNIEIEQLSEQNKSGRQSVRHTTIYRCHASSRVLGIVAILRTVILGNPVVKQKLQ